MSASGRGRANQYGVRTFDLSTARTNQRLRVRADRLFVIRSDDAADLRLGSVNAPKIPLRRIESVEIPDDVNEIYLSNGTGTGQLVILFGVEDITASVGSAEVEGTVDVEDRSSREIGKARIQDSGGVLVDPLAVQTVDSVSGSTGSNSTDVTLTLGAFRKSVDVFVDTSGSATLTVEVNVGGGTWRTFDTVDYSSATTEVEQYNTAYPEIRASVDQNLNTLEAVGKGV